ncbi:hypothetical protein CSAL01_09213 [Colletotrichum salicis]|uniref:Uncharacterized protein n=1 Tax=Colletotrichum salicis TaxID=1209931 RepID=A0A135VA37_9PEZI|nr:hypothetical protein CSAL01_09213 [Colletotrichum salicis]
MSRPFQQTSPKSTGNLASSLPMISTLERPHTPQAPCTNGLFSSPSINHNSAETTRLKTSDRNSRRPHEEQDRTLPTTQSNEGDFPLTNSKNEPSTASKIVPPRSHTFPKYPTQAPHCSTTYPHTGEHVP